MCNGKIKRNLIWIHFRYHTYVIFMSFSDIKNMSDAYPPMSILYQNQTSMWHRYDHPYELNACEIRARVRHRLIWIGACMTSSRQVDIRLSESLRYREDLALLHGYFVHNPFLQLFTQINGKFIFQSKTSAISHNLWTMSINIT